MHLVHSNGYETFYLQLSKMFVHAGEHVDIGKTIGLVGNTGLATVRISISALKPKLPVQELRNTWAPSL